MPTLAGTYPLAGTCPFCFKRLEAATRYQRDDDAERVVQGVEVGNLTLCAYCGEWAFWSGSGFRRPTDEEHVIIAGDKDIRTLRAAWLLARPNFRLGIGRPGSLAMMHLLAKQSK
jgi:hypothetical protein